MTKSLYRMTHSEVNTVEVGSYLIDDDAGRARNWYIYDSTAGELREGFTGKRTHILCDECWFQPQPLVRPYGHDHPRGKGPTLDPTA